MKSLVIAIDGTSASGKGTVASRLAKHFNLPYLDTGKLYRAVALGALNAGIEDYDNEEAVAGILTSIDFSNLDRDELKLEQVGAIASKVSAIKAVRDFLYDFQVNFASQEGGAVLDGRDIGTVICPTADYKFFITATLEKRAERRYLEMKNRGVEVSYEEIFEKISRRDKSDSERTISPLTRAEDAIEVDTTAMTMEEVFDYVLSFIEK